MIAKQTHRPGALLLSEFGGMQVVVPVPLTFRRSRHRHFTPLDEFRAGFILPDGDSYMAWLPIFTDWWDQ